MHSFPQPALDTALFLHQAMGWKQEGADAAGSGLDSTKEEGTCPKPCEKSVAELYRHLKPPLYRTTMNKSALSPVVYPYCNNELVNEWWWMGWSNMVET